MRGFPFRSLKGLAVASAVVLVLFGCQTASNEGLATSKAPSGIPEQAASAIAGDLVSRLAEQIGPGTATVSLKQDSSPFGQALENELKGKGYAVVTDQKTDDGAIVHLAYAVIAFEGQVLARLSTNSVELGRAFTLSASGAKPASALSVMQRS
ncbi:conjugal transfer protein TrbH [Brucella intermedia]|uniref:conjugal transfer protein TrbH n=1 Tax=Brucella intermedia TaxID=94625 RepID=UPI00235E09A0|nr:conjugal transfer protein TrbH [Brucella intermedia]